MPSAAKAMRWKMQNGHGSDAQLELHVERVAEQRRADRESEQELTAERPAERIHARCLAWGSADYRPDAPKRKTPEVPGSFDATVGACRLLGGDLRTIHQLDVRHRRIVAGAEAALEDAQVTTRTLPRSAGPGR